MEDQERFWRHWRRLGETARTLGSWHEQQRPIWHKIIGPLGKFSQRARWHQVMAIEYTNIKWHATQCGATPDLEANIAVCREALVRFDRLRGCTEQALASRRVWEWDSCHLDFDDEPSGPY